MKCDHCTEIIEQDDSSYLDEENNVMCENCWHDECGHVKCEECGEWIESGGYEDEESCFTFCNESCYIDWYSGHLSHLADIAKDRKYEGVK